MVSFRTSVDPLISKTAYDTYISPFKKANAFISRNPWQAVAYVALASIILIGFGRKILNNRSNRSLPRERKLSTPDVTKIGLSSTPTASSSVSSASSPPLRHRSLSDLTKETATNSSGTSPLMEHEPLSMKQVNEAQEDSDNEALENRKRRISDVQDSHRDNEPVAEVALPVLSAETRVAVYSPLRDRAGSSLEAAPQKPELECAESRPALASTAAKTRAIPVGRPVHGADYGADVIEIDSEDFSIRRTETEPDNDECNSENFLARRTVTWSDHNCCRLQLLRSMPPLDHPLARLQAIFSAGVEYRCMQNDSIRLESYELNKRIQAFAKACVRYQAEAQTRNESAEVRNFVIGWFEDFSSRLKIKAAKLQEQPERSDVMEMFKLLSGRGAITMENYLSYQAKFCGSTGYLDGITPDDMGDQPFKWGIDFFKRPYVALKYRHGNEFKVATVFQRYSNCDAIVRGGDSMLLWSYVARGKMKGSTQILQCDFDEGYFLDFLDYEYCHPRCLADSSSAS